MVDTESKKQEVVKDLGEWFAKPNCEEFYYQEPLETIKGNLSEVKPKKSVWLSFDQLENWYKNSFVLKGLKENGVSDRATFAAYGYCVAELTSVLAHQFPNNPPNIGFHKTASFLADVINQGWFKEAEKTLDRILEGLETKFLKGGYDFEKAAWFIVSIACKGFDKNLSKEKYNYPKDHGVYQQVIDKWNTSSTEETDKMVSDLCNYHLEQADFDENKHYQFSFMNEFVYAYEILSWLSIRKMRGLSNPKTFSHPLMNLSINQLPKTSEPLKIPEMYNEILAKFQTA